MYMHEHEEKQEHHHYWQLLLLILLVVMTFAWVNMRTERKLAKRSVVPADYVRVSLVCDKSNNLYVCTSNGVILPINHKVTAIGDSSSEFKHAAY